MSYTPAKPIGVGSVNISPAERRYVNQVLDSNRLSYGPFSRRLEREFARSHDAEHCVLTNSGTSSLHIAVAALKEHHGWHNGDEVVCPAASFVATSNVVLHNDLRPVFVDIDQCSYNMDPALIEASITPRTRAIIVAHLYGQPADMSHIVEVARRRGLAIIEDSCETTFARYQGRSVGSMGDIAAFSTYACHIMATGVGGLTTTNDSHLATLLRSLANHGRDTASYYNIDDSKVTGDELRNVIANRFTFERMGYSYRTTEMEAALGVGQLESMPHKIAIRRSIARRLIEGLAPHEDLLQLPHPLIDRDHSYMMFPMVVHLDAPFTRDDFALYLERHMIETRPMVTTLNQPCYRRLYGDRMENHYPVARWIGRCGLYIGCHPEMTNDDVEYVIRTVADYVGAQR